MARRLGSLLLALAAGCAAPAASVRPADPLATSFSQRGEEAIPDRWWLALPDPALHRLVAAGLAGNLDLRAAWARLDQADAQVRAAGAARRPSLSADVDGAVSARGDRDATTTAASAGLGLAASYEVDLWGRVRASRDAATLAAVATAHDLHAAAVTLSSEIALTWYDLVTARAADALLVRQLAFSEETLELVRLRVGAGLAPADDELRQEQSVEALRADRVLTAADVAVLEHRLAVLLGRAPTDDVAPPGAELVDLPPLPATGVPSEILRRRPDVRAAFARVEAADRQVAAAIADRYPRLTISARASIDAPFTGWLTSLAAGLAAPLLDGGRRVAEVERARAALAERVLAYQATLLQAAREVEDALVQEARQREHLDSLDRQLDLSSQALRAARQRFTSGLADYLRVLDAEQSHQSLERRRLGAAAALIATRITLYRALAGEWELTRST